MSSNATDRRSLKRLLATYLLFLLSVLVVCSLGTRNTGPITGALIIATAFVVSALPLWIAVDRIQRLVEDFKVGFSRIERAKTSVRLSAEEPPCSEMEDLVDGFNRMVSTVKTHVLNIMRQRNEQRAVLEGMVEAVVAIDKKERLVNMNSAAEKLFGATVPDGQKAFLKEVIPNPDFLAFVRQALQNPDASTGELHMGSPVRYFQTQANVLLDEANTVAGVVVVLNDISKLRHLERVRQDFVANVSHELRTPITSVKGFIETLLDGALEDKQSARRFLEIVHRHSDRLESIISDLLYLSKLEQNPHSSLELTDERLLPLIRSCLQICHPRAEAKGVALELTCSEHLHKPVNRSLLEQAVINLVDNAIKYSEQGTAVAVSVEDGETAVIIKVQDKGPGIEESHIPRLFERFYRVDKARSRNMGGTGLGLAIVKHIAQAHGGVASAESTLGEGSTFSITLPKD